MKARPDAPRMPSKLRQIRGRQVATLIQHQGREQ